MIIQKVRSLAKRRSMLLLISVVMLLIGIWNITSGARSAQRQPKRIIVDTDVDTDDVFALFYLLKQDKNEFDLQAITLNTNGWSDSGHAINHVYDILFMMGRDDIPVGVGGEGSILSNGTLLPNVGGYFPIIDQRMSTSGECRYRQAIPVGRTGRQDINTNYGLRKGFLPQGGRHYVPLQQPTSQEVMIAAISAGPITVFLLGAHTNFALFLMSNSHLKKNVEHIFVMGGAIRSSGSLFPQDTNPYAEFNIFSDPLAAYLVLHSGIPVTVIPLDATNTLPLSENFFKEFEGRRDTYEAEYCFRSLKLIRDSWPNNNFHEDYCMWDSFMVGIALSMMRNSQNPDGENEFADMELMNITVVTSNEPYGLSDGSNPINNGHLIPILHVENKSLHSGHVQTGMQDPFCLDSGKGRCQDGYTKEVTGSEAVLARIATRAKPNRNISSSLDKEFYRSFLDVINQPQQTGRFNISTQFPYYKEVIFRPNFTTKSGGQPVVFDMDMSAGDFLALLYLLKLPRELINLKGILVSSTGWATSATIDVIYDVLHMMGRDDIAVGLGNVFAVGQAYPFFKAIGDCKYSKAIPHGSGGFLDSDTLYGLARELPRGPRRYTAEKSVTFGDIRDTDHPEFRQPSALDVWKSVVESLDGESKVTVVTNGPLTNLAEIIQSKNASSVIQEVYIVGGNIGNANEKGNLFTVPWNEYSEFNMYRDPLAAKAVLESDLNITLITLTMQRAVSNFSKILNNLQSGNVTIPEARFAWNLLSRLCKLQQEHHSYLHMDTFSGEILGAVILAGNQELKPTFDLKSIKILAEGDETKIGQIVIDEEKGKTVKILENVNPEAYFNHFAEVLKDHRQSAFIGSFQEQERIWNTPPNTEQSSPKLTNN
ncbi:uncharacterized protein LOC105647839 [Jatropha curcas]|uniref:uncharacterized protein LOC105647839 n=1 Tax=Jatropha curcas TaxID=180498 RepID=UPI0009D6CDFE|nr:uncharacterized protein LOC105647839 [Jatropha curcas]